MELMVDWRTQVEQIGPSEGRQSSALERIDTVLAGESVLDVVLAVRRDVCDEGHLHADAGVWLLTGTRLLSAEINDAHHLHAPSPHDGTSVNIIQLPLRAVQDVSVNSWVAEDGDPVALLSVAHERGRGGGTLTPHQCDDPDCLEGEGTFFLELWDEQLELMSTDGDADAFVEFAGALGIAAASA